MNNTKTVSAIVAVLMAAALVVGGTSAAMTTAHSAFAWKQDSYKKRGDDSYKKDTYMKGVENTYKKGRQANGIYGNDNTVTIQASKQNGQVDTMTHLNKRLQMLSVLIQVQLVHKTEVKLLLPVTTTLAATATTATTATKIPTAATKSAYGDRWFFYYHPFFSFINRLIWTNAYY